MSPSLIRFPLSCLHDEFLEIVGRVQVGVRGEIDLKERTLRAADRGKIVVSSQGAAHIGGADVQRRHAIRFHPDAHGKCAAAEDVGFLHATELRSIAVAPA